MTFGAGSTTKRHKVAVFATHSSHFMCFLRAFFRARTRFRIVLIKLSAAQFWQNKETGSCRTHIERFYMCTVCVANPIRT
jgi:hypothetical protein